jgi:hypothetical protein
MTDVRNRIKPVSASLADFGHHELGTRPSGERRRSDHRVSRDGRFWRAARVAVAPTLIRHEPRGRRRGGATHERHRGVLIGPRAAVHVLRPTLSSQKPHQGHESRHIPPLQPLIAIRSEKQRPPGPPPATELAPRPATPHGAQPHHERVNSATPAPRPSPPQDAGSTGTRVRIRRRQQREALAAATPARKDAAWRARVTSGERRALRRVVPVAGRWRCEGEKRGHSHTRRRGVEGA